MLPLGQPLPPLPVALPRDPTQVFTTTRLRHGQNLLLLPCGDSCPHCRAFWTRLRASSEIHYWELHPCWIAAPAPPPVTAGALPQDALLDVAGRCRVWLAGDAPVVLALFGVGMELAARWPVFEHRFPELEAILAAASQEALQCPECGVSDWPAGR